MNDFNVTFFKALADPTRLQTLVLLSAMEELCVCELTERLHLSQPKISRHLALLRNSGLLADERRGQWVYYRLHPTLPGWCIKVIDAAADNQQQWLAEQLKKPIGTGCC